MIQWTGTNRLSVQEFALQSVRSPGADGLEVYDRLHDTWITVLSGQWIVQGVMGEFYPLDDKARIRSYRIGAAGSWLSTVALAVAFFLLGFSFTVRDPVGGLIAVVLACVALLVGHYGHVKDWVHNDGGE